MAKVTLANGKLFENVSARTILDSARAAGFVLEHSCRTGRCGACKGLVVSGDTEVLTPEDSLTESERKEGYILTCCRAALNDLQLDMEDLGDLASLTVKTLPCRIDGLQMLSDDVVEVILRTPPASQLEYLPGQYIDVIGKEGLRRSYSIANAQREDGKITLQIRKVANGQMSRYWFEEAKLDDLLRLEGPLGTFCLRKSKVANLILLATGTGIAPVKAILEQLALSSDLTSYSDIRVYWGGRTEQDIYWKPELFSLPLAFIPVLSRSDWAGRKGYVQKAVIDDAVDLADSVVYACGSEAMISSAYEELLACGLSAKYFYSDAFVSSN